VNASGSSFSSDYSAGVLSQSKFSNRPTSELNNLNHHPDPFVTTLPQRPPNEYDNYCYFQIIQGIKLPMLMGNKERRFDIHDLIEISTE
jgi:hypothetical protein